MMETSYIAENLEYVGEAVYDKDYYNWCLCPIRIEDKIHMFSVRWDRTLGMMGWRKSSEIIHLVASSPEGPFDIVGTVCCDEQFLAEHPDRKPSFVVPTGQTAPHNVKIKYIDGKYCLVYIVQTHVDNIGQRICMAISDSIYGEWQLLGEKGIVVSPSKTGFSSKTGMGVANPDIVKFNDEYLIYFKCGLSSLTEDYPEKGMRYCVAVSDTLTGPYKVSDYAVTENIGYIEDAHAYVLDGAVHLLTTDNRGINTGVFGYGIIWKSYDGRRFKLEDARVGFKLLSDYLDIDFDSVCYPYGDSNKFERPHFLIEDGKVTHLYATNGTNLHNEDVTNSFILKVRTCGEQFTL